MSYNIISIFQEIERKNNRSLNVSVSLTFVNSAF